MENMEFFDKQVDLDRLSDEITSILRADSYDKISLDVETNTKDNDDRIFRIEAYKKRGFFISTTRLPPIKLQIRGKLNHFLIAQQWSSVDSDTISGVFLGVPGDSLYLLRSLRRRKLEKKYWNLINQKIEFLKKSLKKDSTTFFRSNRSKISYNFKIILVLGIDMPFIIYVKSFDALTIQPVFVSLESSKRHRFVICKDYFFPRFLISKLVHLIICYGK